MKVVFMGTPAFAVQSLKAVMAAHEVVAVCTQPDRPAGRGQKLAISAVKEALLAATPKTCGEGLQQRLEASTALEASEASRQAGIPILQPATLRLSESREVRKQLAAFNADIFIVAAYGLLLPKGVLTMPRYGCINVHASLLPKYRGASPIHQALLNGDNETGITIMQMAEGMDTGDIILQKSLKISPVNLLQISPENNSDTLPQLHDRLATLGAEALLEALTAIENGTASPTPQDSALATHAPMIKKTDGEILPTHSIAEIFNKIRALDPWPGCYINYNGEPLKIFSARTNNTGLDEGITFQASDGIITFTEVQAPGKKRMPAADFLRGRKSDEKR